LQTHWKYYSWSQYDDGINDSRDVAPWSDLPKSDFDLSDKNNLVLFMVVEDCIRTVHGPLALWDFMTSLNALKKQTGCVVCD
jgi:hypothetical protein